jgi:hypothetical protein
MGLHACIIVNITIMVLNLHLFLDGCGVHGRRVREKDS